MISISHWGMFSSPIMPVMLPAGFRLPPQPVWDRERTKPDGVIKLIPTTSKMHKRYLKDLRKAWGRPDYIPGDLMLCAVRFLYRCHRVGT